MKSPCRPQSARWVATERAQRIPQRRWPLGGPRDSSPDESSPDTALAACAPCPYRNQTRLQVNTVNLRLGSHEVGDQPPWDEVERAGVSRSWISQNLMHCHTRPPSAKVPCAQRGLARFHFTTAFIRPRTLSALKARFTPRLSAPSASDSPLPRRYLAVAPLIANQRCYGEVTARLSGGNLPMKGSSWPEAKYLRPPQLQFQPPV